MQELAASSTKTSSSSGVSATNKEQLLENEIKYFKQQIEFLVKENNDSIELLNEKEQVVSRLEKELRSHELDRQNHNKLVEQVHNDKQALSRALQQNKELKDQLAELQDAYVNVTKQNLDLATQLESVKFKSNEAKQTVKEEVVMQQVSQEWDESDESDNQQTKVDQADDNLNNSLIGGIKERLNELEKENKDLNDYITLMDQNLKRNNDQQLSVINSQLKQIETLNHTIREIEDERDKLRQQLNAYLTSSTSRANIDKNNNDNANNTSEKLLEFNEANFNNLLLLEVSFLAFFFTGMNLFFKFLDFHFF